MFLMVSKVNINCLNNKFSCITHTILYLKKQGTSLQIAIQNLYHQYTRFTDEIADDSNTI